MLTVLFIAFVVVMAMALHFIGRALVAKGADPEAQEKQVEMLYRPVVGRRQAIYFCGKMAQTTFRSVQRISAGYYKCVSMHGNVYFVQSEEMEQ